MKSNNIIQSFLTINDLSFVVNNWYYKMYCRIITNVLKENRKKLKNNDPQYVYYESHHIHPRSLGGIDDKDNLILLKGREHFLVHWLLTKFISGSEKYKMMNAFDSMFTGNKKQKENRYIPKYKFSKIYEENRNKISKELSIRKKGKKRPEISGNCHPKGMLGKTHNNKTKIIIGKKMSGEKNGMHGRCAYDIWVEKYGIEEANKRREETNKKRLQKWYNKSEEERISINKSKSKNKSNQDI